MKVAAFLVSEDPTPFVQQRRQGRGELAANVGSAGGPQFIKQRLALLVRETTGARRIAIGSEAQSLAIDHEVNVLGEASNQSECLGKRGAALEQELRMTLRQAVVEGIEDEANPEVFLDVARERVESVGGRLEDVPSVLVGERKETLEALARPAVMCVSARLRTTGAAQLGRPALFRTRSFFTASGSLLFSVAATLASEDACGPSQRRACTTGAEDFPAHAITLGPAWRRYTVRLPILTFRVAPSVT